MKIVVDHVHDSVTGAHIGTMFIDTNDLKDHEVPGQPIGTKAVSWHQILLALNGSKAVRTQGGYDVVSQLPGEIAPMTRWERLVKAANDPGADVDIKALGLTGT